MVIDNKFNFEQTVFLRTDPEQRPRLVTGICARKNFIEYQLACGNLFSWHQEFEISEAVDVITSTTN